MKKKEEDLSIFVTLFDTLAQFLQSGGGDGSVRRDKLAGSSSHSAAATAAYGRQVGHVV